MRPPTFHHERALASQGFTAIGVDEAGCGCLAGPVVAAACWLPLDSRIGLLRDSKLLSATQREQAFALLATRGARWAVGMASVEEIDRINIRQASLLAMRRAVNTFLHRMQPVGEHPNDSNPIRMFQIFESFGLHSGHSDAHLFALVDAWHIPSLSLPQRGIIHGDRLVKSIAAASIVAKCARDTMMDALHREHPQYGFAKHRGYATSLHRDAIQRHGMTPHHRKSFCTHLAPLG